MQIVYVLADNEKLKYYNELIKSVYSLHYQMPEQKICVLTDNDTFNLINKLEITQFAELRPIEVPSDLSVVERSRYLKLITRQVISGEMLFIDADTVIARPFPEIKSEKSIGIVWDINIHRTKVEFCDKVSELCGIPLNDFKYYYNSGVIWSKDNDISHKFFSEWLELWDITRKAGCYKDQPSFNHICEKFSDSILTLDNMWNCQIGSWMSTPLHCFYGSYIIHYFHDTTSAYKLSNPYYLEKKYNDKEMLEILQNPYNAFDECKVLKINDGYYHIKGDMSYRLIHWLWKKHNKIYNMIERILRPIAGHIFKKKTK